MEPEERPPFVADFPRTPALDALVSAFARGDYGRVRRDAAFLMASDASDAEKAAAKELRGRTEPDPMAKVLIALAAALLVLLTIYWQMHDRP